MSKLSSRIAGHDEYHVAEYRLATLVVAQRAIVHHLQQQVKHVIVSLLDLVEQQHTVGMLAHGVGQQASVIITDITRRRTDELGNGVFLNIFAHVEAH